MIREAIAAGAMAYIPKSLDRASITEALRHVLAGETWQPEIQEARRHRQERRWPSGSRR